MAPAVRKTIPPPPDANDGSMNGFAHEQGAFKTIGGKNHQPIDKSRRWNISQFNGLRRVTVTEMEPRPAPAVRASCLRSAPLWPGENSPHRPGYRNRPRSA